MTQTSISQFFSPVTADEARTANLESRRHTANISLSDSLSNPELHPVIGTKSRGNLKIFQLTQPKNLNLGVLYPA